MTTKNLDHIISLIMGPVQNMPTFVTPPHLAYVAAALTPKESHMKKIISGACDRVGILFSMYTLTEEPEKITDVLSWLSSDTTTDAIMVSASLTEVTKMIPERKRLQPISDGEHSFRSQAVSLVLASEIPEPRGKRIVCLSPLAEIQQAVHMFAQTTNAVMTAREHMSSADVIVSAQDMHGSLTAKDLPPNTVVLDAGQTLAHDEILGDLRMQTNSKKPVTLLGKPNEILAIEIALILAHVIHCKEQRI